MKRFIQKTVLSIIISVSFLCFIPQKTYGGHQLGADMSYQCTATPNVYLVRVKIYRDCTSGTQICATCPTSLPATCSINLNIIGGASPCNGTNFGTVGITLLVAQSGYDIVQLCNTQKTICTNCGTRTPGTFSPGVEVFTFEGNVSFVTIANNYPNCCQIKLAYGTGQARSPNITTVNNPGNINYFTELIINRCASPCNASPVFNNSPEVIVCNGVDQNINLGAVDPDGDSLSYALAAALMFNNTSVPYSSPYTATAPFPYLGAPAQSPPAVLPSGMSVNRITGDVQFRPSGNFMAPFVIEVRQWKRVSGVATLMGVTRRDYTLYSQSCPSNSPVTLLKYDSSGIALGTYGYTGDSIRICPGERFCRIFVAADTTLSDSTDLSWSTNSNMAGATFTALYNTATRSLNGPRLDSFKFCWTAPGNAGSLNPYVFTVMGRDRFCNLPAKVLRSVAIYVNQLPQATISKTLISKNTVKFKYVKTNAITNTPSLTQWQIETLQGSNVYTTFNSDSINSYTFPVSGNYKIKLTLSNPNCGNITFMDSIYMRFLTISMVSKTNIICKGDSGGSIALTSVGGAGSVQYKLNSGTYQSSGMFDKLLAGNYLATVRDSFNTTDTLSFIITEPATAIGLTSSNIVNLKCKGDSIGQATLTVSNGTPPFQYKIAGSGYQSSNIFTNLRGGNNTLIVADSNNCQASTVVVITEPVNKLNGSLQLTNPLCYGGTGSAILYASGGNTPYYYRIDGGSYNLVNSFNGLIPKAYTFTLKDWNNCELTYYGTITSPTQLVVNAIKNNITCYGFTDGKVTLNASGAMPPYQYKKGTGAYISSNIFGNLLAGNYTFTTRDSNACTVITNVNISGPATPLTKKFTYTNATCLGANNGAASIVLSGGVLPYSYSWNTIPVQTGSSVSNLAPGFIKVVAVDSNLCTLSDSANITYKPLYNNEQICAVTVDTVSGKNVVIWNKTSGVGIAAYKIYASVNLSGPFNLVDSQSYNAFSSYTDNVSASLKQSYYYQLKVQDSCGNESTTSATHRTIYATVTAVKPNTNALSWNTYSGAASASGYIILRSANKGPFINIKQLPMSATAFTDSLAPNGTMRYLIELVFSAVCNPTSNKAGAIHVYSNLMDMGLVGVFEEESRFNSFEVYPNPSRGLIKINALKTGLYIESVDVINVLGSTVITQKVQGLNREITIDMNELADGVYHLLIQSTAGIKIPVNLLLNRGM